MNEVLFEDGDWRICQTGHFDLAGIYHMCGDEFNLNEEWWHISAEDRCVYCRVTVPDPIMGLYILYTWDRS